MRYLKTNTATRITVGPFLDVTDGVTPEVALTVTNDQISFVVDNAGVPTLVLDVAPTAAAGDNDMVHVANDDAGFYDLELTAANVNYVGRAIIAIFDTDVHLPVFHEFMILSAQAYDSLCGTGNLSADIKAITAGVDFSAVQKASIATATTDVAIAEMAQGAPTATPTMKEALMYLYMAWRNRQTTTATLTTMQNDAGTVVCKATLSDDATTFTKAEFVTGA